MKSLHQLVICIIALFGVPINATTDATPPNHFRHPKAMTLEEFTDLLNHPDKRKSKSTSHITQQYKDFTEALAGNNIRTEKIPDFLNALWNSSLEKEQLLDGVKKVARPLATLAQQNPSNTLIMHLNNALQKHTTPPLPNLISLKRQYTRAAQDDYRAAQSIGKLLFHNPGAKVGIVGLASVLGAGIGIHLLKKQNQAVNLMTLQHHVLRHKILQDFGSSDIEKLKEILRGSYHKKITPQGKSLIERYLKLDTEYREKSKSWLKALSGATIGSLGTAAAAYVYKNQTPLQTIK